MNRQQTPQDLCNRLEWAVMDNARHNGKTDILRTEIWQTAQIWLINWVREAIERAAKEGTGKVGEICRKVADPEVASCLPCETVFDSDKWRPEEFGGYKISRPFAKTLEELAEACTYESASCLLADILDTYLNDFEEICEWRKTDSDLDKTPSLRGRKGLTERLEARARAPKGRT